MRQGRLAAGQTVLIHGAAGGVGSIAVQLAREAGARVIGTGRPADRDRALGLGVDTFLDLQTEKLEDVGVLLYFAGLAVMAIVFVWRFLPETKGLAVEDIVKLFEPSRQPPATSGQPPTAVTRRITRCPVPPP
jgi:NAD(P)-dependent dehydrogenase (short-subunit alcohol dehydrogenase family)